MDNRDIILMRSAGTIAPVPVPDRSAAWSRTTAQLNAEQILLVKADRDIKDGRQCIRDQERRVRELMVGGRDTRQAERLVDLLKETLVEWERHRVLIAQRVEYLRQEVAAG